MTTILDLISVSPADERVGLELLVRNPKTCIEDYRKMMREIPNLHIFISRIRATYPDPSIASMVWFRLWCALKAEEEIGITHTLNLLQNIPDIDDRPIELKKYKDGKIVVHCFKVLHELISTAHLPS